MRVLVTGHRGYLGPCVVEALQDSGHEVVGLDSGLFVHCSLEQGPSLRDIHRDVRDATADDLRGLDAVVHLAGLSNDPLGHLDANLTHEINAEASVRLGELACRSGVRRFVFSSSCSVYGATAEHWVDETTPPQPLTAYARSKVDAEQRLASLATDRFCVTSLRNATAFGYSPYFRSDLVVNDFVAGAFLRGRIQLNSDGSAWRPLIHARDIAAAIVQVLTAPTDAVNGAVINVGADEQNYTVMEIARTVADALPAARLTVADGAGPDRRSYRVRFGKLRSLLPTFRCAYDLRAGVQDLVANFERIHLQSVDDCVRLSALQRSVQAGRLDASFRPCHQVLDLWR